LVAATQAWCQAPAPQGEIKGQAIVHTPESARAAMANGALVLPSAATGGAVFTGAFKDAPRETRARVPVVVFLHGSSGLGLKAIGEWQQWLATMGIASFAPDSFALPGRVTYTSPVGKDFYEKIHALRGSEITLAVQALKDAPWADPRRMVLAGTSEGATAVARYAGDAFAARMIFSWSCEDNYFVETHRTAVRPEQPVLNVISATDPFFSRSNAWLGQPAAVGHCAAAFKDHPKASIVLIPGAPHTLLNLPAARQVVAGYLQDALK
jgi:dienelactone hydrolase